MQKKIDLKFQKRRHHRVGGEQRLAPTQLGLACLASSLAPDDSLMLLAELEAARKGLILDTDLHLVYQVLLAPLPPRPLGIALDRRTPNALVFHVLQLFLFDGTRADNADVRVGSDVANRLAALPDAVGGTEPGPPAGGRGRGRRGALPRPRHEGPSNHSISISKSVGIEHTVGIKHGVSIEHTLRIVHTVCIEYTVCIEHTVSIECKHQWKHFSVQETFQDKDERPQNQCEVYEDELITSSR